MSCPAPSQDGELMRAEQEARAAARRKQALQQKLGVQTQMVARAHIQAAEGDDKLRALEVARQVRVLGALLTSLTRDH